MKLLLKHGGDPKLKNRDGATPLDLAKDQEIADLLRGKVLVNLLIFKFKFKIFFRQRSSA